MSLKYEIVVNLEKLVEQSVGYTTEYNEVYSIKCQKGGNIYNLGKTNVIYQDSQPTHPKYISRYIYVKGRSVVVKNIPARSYM